MFIKIKILLIFSVLGLANACENQDKLVQEKTPKTELISTNDLPKTIVCGADRSALYLPKLQGKKIALLVNQTSRTKNSHLVDFLLSKQVNIQKIFAPEHGFRGKADAGEQVKDGKDLKTGLPIVSLYGKNKKPSAEQLKGIDLVLFDIQDVGARFYTYISSMTYVMEACAENDIDFMVLDRPNPNGHYIDGPILEKKLASFVGLHQVPIVHGMTVGEYAQMLNGEAWLKDGKKVNLEVIPCANYDHTMFYELPVKPSPNLPNIRSIYLYPSLCLFEGTAINVGRGTKTQFQVIGHPDLGTSDYSYTPISMEGAKYPKHENKACKGLNLSTIPVADLQKEGQINIDYWLETYKAFPDKDSFFLENNFFEKLAGTSQLRQQLIDQKSAAEIRASWKEGLDDFQKIRQKYLIYPDFE